MSEANSFGVSHTGLPDDNRALEPPDPIPNSDVKRCIADGSVAFRHVRVGHRQASNNKHPNRVSGWGVFLSVYVGMTYSLRVAERRPGHRQASNIKAPIRNGWGFLLCAIKKCVPGLPMTNGHGDARHLWRAGLRPAGKADALNYMEQFSQASNTNTPIRNVWFFTLCFGKVCSSLLWMRAARKRPGNPSSQPDL